VNWDQLKSILWLRWRLARNQMMRGKGVGAVIAAIIAVAACLIGAISFVVALLCGIYALDAAKSIVLWSVWCGATMAFLFLWTIGLLQELQRSETIDLQRLMHLPVALGQMFVINYIASHFALSIVIFLPAMMGLTLGLTISRGPSMLLLVPLVLGLIFTVTAWTYCLRGWLASLMSNPRRRRNVMMVIVMSFILLAQAPNLYFNVFRHIDRPDPGSTPEQKQRWSDERKADGQNQLSRVLSLQKFIPPLWLAAGAKGLAEGRPWPALLGTLGFCAFGALGLRRAYQGTLRFYRGETGGKSAGRAEPNRKPALGAATPATAGSRFLELRLPGVPEQSAALALSTFQSMLRAPEVKIAWGSSFLVPLLVGGSLLFRASLKVPEAAKPFIATGAVAFSIFMLVQFFANQFGFDRDGFRALVLSPADRKLILLGKNLACLPVGLVGGLLLLVLSSVRLQTPPLVLVASVLQLAALLFLVGMAGNLCSILVPFRIQQGSMKPTKMPGLAIVTIVICQMLFPLAMAPAFVPPLAEYLWQRAGLSPIVPVNLILSAMLAAVLGLTYWLTLTPLGRLLHRRETRILGIVTVEVE
jgi:ABC-2 type transport system permease protein